MNENRSSIPAERDILYFVMKVDGGHTIAEVAKHYDTSAAQVSMRMSKFATYCRFEIYESKSTHTPRAKKLARLLVPLAAEISSAHRRSVHTVDAFHRSESQIPDRISTCQAGAHILSTEYLQEVQAFQISHGTSIISLQRLRDLHTDIAIVTEGAADMGFSDELAQLPWRSHKYLLYCREDERDQLFAREGHTWEDLAKLSVVYLARSYITERIVGCARRDNVQLGRGTYLPTLEHLATAIRNSTSTVGFLPSVYECEGLVPVHSIAGDIVQRLQFVCYKDTRNHFRKFLLSLGVDMNSHVDYLTA